MVTQFPPVREFCDLVAQTSSRPTNQKKVECLCERLGLLCTGLGACCGYVRVRGGCSLALGNLGSSSGQIGSLGQNGVSAAN